MGYKKTFSKLKLFTNPSLLLDALVVADKGDLVRQRWWMIPILYDRYMRLLLLGIILCTGATFWGFLTKPAGYCLSSALFFYFLANVFYSLRAFYNAKTQKSEALYLWSFGKTRNLGPAGQLDEEQETNLSIVRINLLSLQNAVKHALQPALDMISFAPPPSEGMSEVEADLLWSIAPYMRRSVDAISWREAIKKYAHQCQVVVIECSEITESLRWEIETVKRVKEPKRILLVCEKNDEGTAALIRKLILGPESTPSHFWDRRRRWWRRRKEAPILSRKKKFKVDVQFYLAVNKWALRRSDLDMPVRQKRTQRAWKRLAIGSLLIISLVCTVVSLVLYLWLLLQPA